MPPTDANLAESTAPPSGQPLLVDIPTAARRLCVTESWLRRAVTARTVPHHRLGKHVRFSDEDLAAITAASRIIPAAPEPAALRPSRRRSA